MTKPFKFFLTTLGLLFFLEVASQDIPVWKLSDLKNEIKNSKGPTIINFWATFCKPCIAELPHFQLLAKQYEGQGVKLIMVSLDLRDDYPLKVGLFVKRLVLSFPVVYLDESNADLFCPSVDSSWSGAIPASLFVNNASGYRKFYEEEISKKIIEKEIKNMLKPEN